MVEKHGINEILKPFIEDLNALAAEGISVVRGGIERTFRGTLLAWLGDNLGSNTVGGFKQSFSFAFRFCRACYITNDEYKTQFTSSELELMFMSAVYLLVRPQNIFPKYKA